MAASGAFGPGATVGYQAGCRKCHDRRTEVIHHAFHDPRSLSFFGFEAAYPAAFCPVERKNMAGVTARAALHALRNVGGRASQLQVDSAAGLLPSPAQSTRPRPPHARRCLLLESVLSGQMLHAGRPRTELTI